MSKKADNDMQAGQCLNCSGFNLDYSGPDFDDNQMVFKYTCNDCSCKCEEVYSVEYLSTTLISVPA